MTNDKARRMKEKYKVALVLLAVVFMVASIFAYYMDVDSIDKAAADVATPGAVAGLAEQAGETPTDGENVENIENTEGGAPSQDGQPEEPPAENENGGSETSEPAIEEPPVDDENSEGNEGETSGPAVEEPQDGSGDGEGETSGPAVEEPPVQLPVVTERPVMRAAAAPLTNTINLSDNPAADQTGTDWSYNQSDKEYTVKKTNGTAVVTIKGAMAVGSTVDAKKVVVNSNANITLDGVTVSNWHDDSTTSGYGAFIEIENGYNAIITLTNTNIITMKPDYDNYTYAAMYLKESGSLTIQGNGILKAGGSIMQTSKGTINIKSATINVVGSKKSAGIGSNIIYSGGGTININEGSNVSVAGIHGAGIGSSKGAGGTINIRGDSTVVSATGGDESAGIGGYVEGSGGIINITDGSTVVATGGRLAAGIGGGSRGDSGTITINGGSKVTATGGVADHSGPGIGGGGGFGNWDSSKNSGGNKNTNSDITIGTSGDTTTEVVATAGDVREYEGGAGIGGGYGCGGGNITINGGNVSAFGKEGGAGIGGGHRSPDGGTIEINGGEVLAVGQYDIGGDKTAVGGAGIGGAGGSGGGGVPATSVTINQGANVRAYSQDPAHPAIDTKVLAGSALLVNAYFSTAIGNAERNFSVYNYLDNDKLWDYTLPVGVMKGSDMQSYRCFAYTTANPNFIMVWDKSPAPENKVEFRGLAVDESNDASKTYLIQPYAATTTSSGKPRLLPVSLLDKIIVDKPTAEASRQDGVDGETEEVVVLKSAVLRWPFTEDVNNGKVNGTDYGFRSGIGSSIPKNDADYLSPWEPDPDQEVGANNVIASPSSIVKAALEANSRYYMQTFAKGIKIATPWKDINPKTVDYSFESDVVPFATLPKVTSAAAVRNPTNQNQYLLSAQFYKNPGGEGQAANVPISDVKIYYSEKNIDKDTYLSDDVKDADGAKLNPVTPQSYSDTGFANHAINAQAGKDYNFLVVIDNTADGLAGGGRDAYPISKGGAPTTLTVLARASGEFAERTKEFEYTATFKDSTGKPLAGNSLQYKKYNDGEEKPITNGSLALKNGVAQKFELKHGEEIVISGVPDNAKIEIKQAGVDLYETSYYDKDAKGGVGGEKEKTGNKGEGVTLSLRDMSAERVIKFTNDHKGIPPPTAVDAGGHMVLIPILAAVLIGAIYLAWWVSRRRLQR